METIDKAGLVPLFEHLDAVFTRERETLITLDGQVGDSDLGITMNKAFRAAAEAVKADALGADESSPVGRTLALAGMAMAKAAPSTMGTLTATGFLRGGKALDGVVAIGPAEMATFWEAWRDGVMERGKAKPGDKTVVDVLVPIAEALRAAAATGDGLVAALDAAVTAATAGLEATTTMVAQHGKAAAFSERTRRLVDAGATVGLLIITAFRDTAREAG